MTKSRERNASDYIVPLVLTLTVTVLLVLLKHAISNRVEAADEGWTTIFNGRNFDGWYTYLRSSGKNKDPKGIFKVEHGAMHVFDIPPSDEKQEFGYVATEREYSNCRIRVDYKWGKKQFSPRATGKRDAGLLYDVVGPDKVWPRMLEARFRKETRAISGSLTESQ